MSAIPDDTLLADNRPPEGDPLTKIKQIIPIAPNSKFVIIIPDDAIAQYEDIQSSLRDWWKSDDPFLLAGESFQLVKVDDDTKTPAFVTCGADNCPGHIPGSGERCGDVEGETLT